MKTYAVYFRPCGALATWPLASDTLFGAVCWGIRILGLMDDQMLTNWLENQRLQPRFAFSNAFPCYLDGERVRFYPRPVTFQPSFRDFDALVAQIGSGKKAYMDAAKAGKQFKKVSYISEETLAQILAGNFSPRDGLSTFAIPAQSNYSVKSGMLCTNAEAKRLPERLEKLYEIEAIQHNQVDRMAGATVEGMLFYREEMFFAPGAGLWALLKAEEDDVKRYIRPALNYLADTGFGADRTTGKGHFQIWLEEFQLPFSVPSPKAMMTLSHYLPLSDECNLQAEPLAYTLKVLRPKREQKYPRPLAQGQQSAPVYKQAVPVFEPGSVFALQKEKEIYGQLVRLTSDDEEPVYQSGAALMITM